MTNKTDKNKTDVEETTETTETKNDANLDSVDEVKATATSSASSSKSNTAQKQIPQKNTEKNMPKTANNSSSKTKVSKSSILAIALSLTAIGLIAGLFYFDKQERASLSQQLSQQLITTNEQNNLVNQQKITQLLAKQQTDLLQQFNRELMSAQKNNQEQLTHLNNTVEKLKQNQPSDWLIHEAEYLIRIAGRTLWLERDTKAAIALLKDADNRLKSLNDPNYFLVRQAVNDDVEALKLVPEVKAEETMLTLMAMSKKIATLKLKMVDIPESVDENENLELSNSATDWRENLAKTWKKFLTDFITVNRRETNVEPLMSVNAQQHLRENLRLKLQVAQWAVSEEKSQLYLQVLSDIESWLNEYFIIENSINQNFIKGISQLKEAKITFDYAQGLSSLKIIRAMMTVPSTSTAPTVVIKKAAGEIVDKNESTDNSNKQPLEKVVPKILKDTTKELSNIDANNNNSEEI